MIEVEIKIKRTDELGNYFEIAPIGELNDKYSLCGYYLGTDEEVLVMAKTILNNQINQ